MFTSSKTQLARRWLGAATLGLILLAALFASPWGRALAQNVLVFFTRTPANVVAHTPGELATAQADNFTLGPVAAAAQQAGFAVLVPQTLPPGYQVEGADYDPEHQLVHISYVGGDQMLWSRQQPAISPTCTLCGAVGPETQVEAVTIGDLPGEYVTGTWKGTEAGWTWDPDEPLHTVRWQNDGMVFEISGWMFDKEALLAMAASLR